MNNYGELNHEAEKRMQLAFKGKREHMIKVHKPNMAFPGQHIDTEIVGYGIMGMFQVP